MASSWEQNPEAEEILKDCVVEGVAYSQISTRIKEKTGLDFSRNACIGRASRLGIASKKPVARPSQAQKEAAARARQLRTVKRALRAQNSPLQAKVRTAFPTEPLPMDVRPSLTLSLDELQEHHCRWCWGDPQKGESYGFCTEHKVMGKQYCEEHVRRVFQPPQVQRSAFRVEKYIPQGVGVAAEDENRSEAKFEAVS